VSDNSCLLMSVPTLGEVIREYRAGRSMSQAALARVAGVESQTISNIETGKTKGLRSDQFAAVAKAMGLTAEELTSRVSNGTGRIAAEEGPVTLDESLSRTVRLLAAEEGIPAETWVLHALVAYSQRRGRKGKLRIARINAEDPNNVTLTRDEIPRPTPE
jgi:transcriptional regulator with XRE-family HTH domain